jgi:hypothetical protein
MTGIKDEVPEDDTKIMAEAVMPATNDGLPMTW